MKCKKRIFAAIAGVLLLLMLSVLLLYPPQVVWSLISTVGANILGVLFLCFLALFFYFGLKKFWILVGMNILLLVVSCVSGYFFCYRPNVGWQMLSILSMFGFLLIAIINLIGIFRYWENYGLVIILLLAMPFILFYATRACGDLGHQRRIDVFNSRLGEYEDVVKLVMREGDEDGVHWMFEQIPEEYRHLAYSIDSMKYGEVFSVIFLWGGGFPVKHSGFAYIPDGNIPPKGSDFCREWPHVERINEHWFRVGD
jgi:hypothetical protein